MASHNHSRNGLSLFSFKLGSNGSSKSSVKGGESTSPTNRSIENHQLSSPVNSPLLMGDEASDMASEANSDIFERSVQDSCTDLHLSHPQPKCNRCTTNRSRSCTHNSSLSLQGGLKNEDFIPPAIDATTSILSDEDTNLDDIEMVYSNRRNSSVIGLNMALGRPFGTSRKNSTYSLQLSQPQATQQTHSPISPPKLTSSKSSLSFYSYADMINNEEMQRRPSFKQSYSYSQNSFPLKKKSHVGSIPPPYKKSGQSLLSKELSTKTNSTTASPNQSFSNQNFLILPESSDSEHDNYFQGKRKSVSSNLSSSSRPNNLRFDNDNESLVSSSVGDCLRQSTTEINGN
mmetsp:Transcript_3903/g.3788  ORF Transcript_3903/g.3788 Transcript_3903/m.3788 type:complete len:345 (+) Transcript_3903:90-1124(+)